MPDDPYFGDALLALADGRVFRGRAFGARATAVGEVVFNTSMTGYQEILTDPSYAGQLVCLTVSEVGNVGCNPDDDESRSAGAEALLVRALSPVVSNHRATTSLPAFLAARGVPGIGEIDTRALTRHLRTAGSIMGAISSEILDAGVLVERARQAVPMEGRALAHAVSTREAYAWTAPSWGNASPPPVTWHVVAFDFGIKLAILQRLRDVGVRTTVVPSWTRAEAILELAPDGVVLSNGPGDPAALEDIIATVRGLFELAPELPVFGICLGHQLMCLALGGETYKLKFGHHGGNHPVRKEATGAVEITAQNHGFAAMLSSLGEGAELTHRNLFDDTVAGLRMRGRPVMGVQYHPEASPGPHDAEHLFEEFVGMIRARLAG